MYNVGCYIRQSRDSESSNSIENQKAILTQFVRMMPNRFKTRTYIDENASGGNFNRRGFQDMMEDIRRGVVNLVLVKDLSRFGRNYLEVGRYLEEELPALGCRFVALADNIDTEKDGDSDFMALLNIMNDFYLRNLSEKVRAVLAAKARDGQKITGAAPYGYLRNPQRRTQLIPSEHAEIIRLIFEERARGMSCYAIAGKLNKDGILSPKGVAWGKRTIKLILQNEAYIGNTVSLKRKIRSYRDKREVRRDESEWIRVDNTHEPIIDTMLWQAVQAIKKNSL
jgi:DNA invertase Pin-like site-specific DNA recombinase